jgi:hypothetical protein
MLSFRATAIGTLLFVSTLFVAFAAAAGTAAGSDTKAMAVLDQAAAAMGEAHFGNAGFVRTKAKISVGGLNGTYEQIVEAKTGHIWDFTDMGVVSEHDGYDGKSAWTQDASGQVSVEDTDDAIKGALNSAYQNAHGYWHRDRWPADISYTGAKTEGGRNFDVLRITPKGGRPFELWFDAGTHLIDRLVEQQATRTTTTFSSDYRSVDGVQLPFKTRQTNGETKYDSTVAVDSITFENTAPAGIFSPPPPPKRDFGVASGATRTTVPFKLINNHMYVAVMLNGKGPYELLFDTGGMNVITPTLATELGLKPQGALQGSGSGEKSADVGVVKIAREEIGQAHLDNQVFAVIGLESFGSVEGVRVFGIFGFEVFKRFIVRTDYEKHEIVLTDPKGWTYQGTGTRTSFKLKDIIPVVPGEIDGIAGDFQLDTGSRVSLDLMTHFVDVNKLVDKYGAKLAGVDGWGVGGAARSWIVRAHSFTFGGVTVEDPVVGLSKQRSGAFADIYSAGNVGAGILKRFNITWDYAHNQIFFEKNLNYGVRDVFDRAGMWVNLDEKGFDVVDVYDGAPAAQAGLRTGDTILTVDGKKAVSEISLPDFRLRLRDGSLTTLKLDVARGGQVLHLSIALRDLV